MSKQAHYHQQGKAPLLLTILKKNANGTVDLGIDGVVKVSECEVSKETPTPFGTCTLLKEDKAQLKATAIAARQEADKLKKLAVDVRKDADTAKGKPEYEDLLAAAEGAESDAAKADALAEAAEKAAK